MIRALDVSKVHGHDNISVRIIKLCTNSVAHSLTLIFQSSMAAGTFATQWKRANIGPIHKKNDKQMYQIIDQYFFCLYAVKFLESLFSMDDSNFLRTKICHLNINWVFTQVIHVFINSLQSLATSFQVLILQSNYKLALCFLIYLKRLI